MNWADEEYDPILDDEEGTIADLEVLKSMLEATKLPKARAIKPDAMKKIIHAMTEINRIFKKNFADFKIEMGNISNYSNGLHFSVRFNAGVDLEPESTQVLAQVLSQTTSISMGSGAKKDEITIDFYFEDALEVIID